MNKKKGFTLVELLAVIVILAIIALIATPIILNVISDAKKQAALESFKGYIDGAEKAIVLNEFEDEKDTTFPKADENGCYNLKDLDKKINIKGTKPTIAGDSKACFESGVVTSITGLTFSGYEVKYTKDKGYEINGKVVEKDDKKELTGIPSKEYTQGGKVSYLGYNWIVMRDNGTNTQLVMDGYLSADELTANLPSDVDSSKVNSSGRISLCLPGQSAYCNVETKAYSWNTSIVKPTIEKWINSKMVEKGLDKETELKGMSFTDGVETINSYIRLSLYDEVKAMNGICTADSGYQEYSPYCADASNYMFTNYDYLILTKTKYGDAYFVYWRNSPVDGPGGVFEYYPFNTATVRPVITVNEK